MLLNKLTVEKEDIVTAEILAIPITSAESLSEVVRLVFEKATDDADLTSVYAKICKRIQDQAPEFAHGFTFRRALLNMCQMNFEMINDGEVGAPLPAFLAPTIA